MRIPRFIDRHDRLKHFKGDGPAWRITALLIEKAPEILRSGALMLMAATALWW